MVISYCYPPELIIQSEVFKRLKGLYSAQPSNSIQRASANAKSVFSHA